MTKQEKASQAFDSGLNCAQSVMLPFAEELQFDPKLALKISCGFGAGMGRLQKTCGAVTGSFMVIGIYNCGRYIDNQDRKEKSYAMIRSFNDRFMAIHDTTDCKNLIRCDLQTEEGQRYAKENGLFVTVCDQCVRDAVAIVDDLIANGV